MNDEKIWLETEDGQKLFIIKSEKIDMQEELNKTIEKLYQELQRKDNVIKQTIGTIKELIDDSEDTTCYEITNTVKKLLLEELETGRSDE